MRGCYEALTFDTCAVGVYHLCRGLSNDTGWHVVPSNMLPLDDMRAHFCELYTNVHLKKTLKLWLVLSPLFADSNHLFLASFLPILADQFTLWMGLQGSSQHLPWKSSKPPGFWERIAIYP
jgi:hypothetical protein